MTERATAKAIPVVAHMYGVMVTRNLNRNLKMLTSEF